MRTFGGHVGIVESLAFSPDGRSLASGGTDASYRLWDVVSGKQLHSGRLSEHDAIGAVAFSPDGRLLAVGDYGGRVSILDLTGREVPREWNNQGRIVGLAFAPGGEWLAWASYTHLVFCPFADERPLHTLGADQPRAFCLAVSPDGLEAAVGSKCGGCLLWNLMAQTSRQLTHGSEQGCWGTAYSPDGRFLAMALGDGAQVWDLATGMMVVRLDGHEEVVSGVAYSPDGRRLATCGWDGTARLYDAATMALVASYDWKIGRLFCVAFSPDGMLAATGGEREAGLVTWDVE